MRNLSLLLALVTTAVAAPLTINLSPPPPPQTEGFHMGTARSPDGRTLTLDSRSLLLDGRRWTPVMGEFHYARYPAAEWCTELRKMKAGGVDIVATYVFWIHHEETEGAWDWAGDKQLRAFIEAAASEGLKVIVRVGPWCHGEVRNGGLPDWVVARGKVRTDDAAYLALVKKLYAQIAAQVGGLLWKEGGPIIGIQLENEYGGPAEHLLTLKQLAREAGLDVPLYTRTGWPELKTPMPFGEIVPLYGVYAEGFWDRELTAMPGQYWAGFHFSTLRTDANIANEALGRREVRDAPDVARYPYLTCEIGGGMMSSYHRRILPDARDAEATTLVKLGSGSNSPGYYMYHGGTNPEGRLTTLMEEQGTAITNWNDMPLKNYDFHAPLGQYGQVRESFVRLRRLHSFLHGYGERLAGMVAFLPETRPGGKDDVTTLRWAVRSDGRSGFVFVNNHERGRELPAKEGVQFAFTLATGARLGFPETPVTVPAGAVFFWPFNLEIAPGGTLAWATVQPLGVSGEGSRRTFYFVETPGVVPEFAFAGVRVIALRGKTEVRGDGLTRVHGVTPGTEPALVLNSSMRVVVLSEAESLRLPLGGEMVTPLAVERVRVAGPAREIPLGKCEQPVPAMPVDADFAVAAVWRIALPKDLDLTANPLLRLTYAGDVARVYVGGKFVNDDYYHGAPLEIGLGRWAREIGAGAEITVQILPLRADSPVYFSASTARPDFAGRPAVAELRGAELVLPGAFDFSPFLP